MWHQIIEKSEASGCFKDQFAFVSLGTNLIYYFTMRLRSIKLIGQRVDKKHKEYKEAKKSIKNILKRQQFRGNVVPWCQFADFELETSSLVTVMEEVYNQALQLAWSLKQKSTLEKALVSSFYVLAHISESIMMRCDTYEYFDQLRKPFISVLGSILLDEEAPVLDKDYDHVQILKIRSILHEKYENAKEAYKHEVNSYYGWFWADSTFVNIIKIMACFELFVDKSNLEQTLALCQTGLDSVTECVNKYLSIYDSTILDDPQVRRRRADLYSLHRLQLKLLSNFSRSSTAKWRITKFRLLLSRAMSDFPDAPEFLAQWLAIESHTVGLRQSGLSSMMGRNSAVKQIYLIMFDLEREKRVMSFNEGVEGTGNFN